MENQWPYDNKSHFPLSQVACRHLNFFGGLESFKGGTNFPRGTGSIHLNNVECVGTEDDLNACPHSTDGGGCSHNQDAEVECQAGTGFIGKVYY